MAKLIKQTELSELDIKILAGIMYERWQGYVKAGDKLRAKVARDLYRKLDR